MTFEKFELKLKEFLAEGYAFLEKVEKMQPIPYYSTVVGFVKYDDYTCEQYKSEISVWQRKAKEAITLFFGEDDYHTIEFCETIPVRWSGLNYKREFKRVITDSIDNVEGFVQLLDEHQESDIQEHSKTVKSRKIFISHSSLDKKYADVILDLLRAIGVNDTQIFYSSSVSNGIPLGQNSIIDTLLKQFKENELYVIMVHSPRYYHSIISMNEVGAAWVLGSKHCSFLTQDCTYGDLKAVINNQEIVFKADAEDATERLGEFIDQVVNFFNLEPLSTPKLIQIVKRFEKDIKAVVIEQPIIQDVDLGQSIPLHHESSAADMFSSLDENDEEPQTNRESLTLKEIILNLGRNLQYPINRWNLSEVIRNCFGRISDDDIESIIVMLSKEGLIEYKSFANDDFGADSTYSFTSKGFQTYIKLK